MDDNAAKAMRSQESRAVRQRASAAFRRRQRILEAMGDPAKAWASVLDDADAGRDTTSSLLLAIASELHTIVRKLRP